MRRVLWLERRSCHFVMAFLKCFICFTWTTFGHTETHCLFICSFSNSISCYMGSTRQSIHRKTAIKRKASFLWSSYEYGLCCSPFSSFPLKCFVSSSKMLYRIDYLLCATCDLHLEGIYKAIHFYRRCHIGITLRLRAKATENNLC